MAPAVRRASSPTPTTRTGPRRARRTPRRRSPNECLRFLRLLRRTGGAGQHRAVPGGLPSAVLPRRRTHRTAAAAARRPRRVRRHWRACPRWGRHQRTPALDHAALAGVATLVDHLEATGLRELERTYVETFDLSRKHALYL